MNPVTTGLNSEEDAEKCRTERRKMLPIITRVSNVELVKVLPGFQVQNARSKKLQPKASTKQASPFCTRSESNTSGFESAVT